MRILVTGGAGFIGSHIAEAYLQDGWDVVVLDDLSRGSERNVPKGARLVRADIRSPEARQTLASQALENQVFASRTLANQVWVPSQSRATSRAWNRTATPASLTRPAK